MDNYNDVIKACNQIYQLLSLRIILITEGIFLKTKRFNIVESNELINKIIFFAN